MKQIIFKGCHYSTFFPWFKFPKEEFEMSKTITFDQSCNYKIDEKACVNKLFGVAFGFGVHKNSVRFGWTSVNDNNIIIYKYTYVNGVLHKNPLDVINTGEQHNYTITIEKMPIGNDYQVLFKMDDSIIGREELTGIRKLPCFLTTLGFYFGGKTRAPHTMFITVN